jgi:DNA (cytosine-5)-methyltransferase 1
MAQLRLLDLFCGAGGCAKGYQQAGFYVVGVDIKDQPRYCGDEFIKADAMSVSLTGFDVIHASPPCQKHSALRHLHPEKEYECWISRAREALRNSGKPYVIENVPGAPLVRPIQLCGSAFGLRVRRHRHFESNVPLWDAQCAHWLQDETIDVSGTGGRRINSRPDDHGGNKNAPRNLADGRDAMGISWMTRKELAQAIPPAYTEYIGRQLIERLRTRRILAATESPAAS